MSNVLDPGWDNTIWDNIKKAVHDEAQRTQIAQKILPLNGPLANAVNVPSDIIDPQNNTLIIPEGVSTPLIEISVPFALTKTQVQQEQELTTALSLARLAANLIANAQDRIIFQGNAANLPQRVNRPMINANNDWQGFTSQNIPSIVVASLPNQPGRYGENTFTRVAAGIGQLQENGHYGPYALILPTAIYSDTFAPLGQNTLVMPADRIKPLVEKGFYATGALPPDVGVLLSIGGNVMDLTIGVDTMPEFMNVDNNGRYRFRVFTRFVPRLKDINAARRLLFENNI